MPLENESSMLFVDLLSRFVHVLTAIVLLGGTIYLRYILIPSAVELPDAEHDALRQRLRGRWRKVVSLGILLLVVTGFWNYLMVGAPAHQGDNHGRYHMLMGIKVSIALVVFFLASALTGRAAKLESLRRSPVKWLTLLIVLAAVTVGLGSALKIAVPPSVPASVSPVAP